MRRWVPYALALPLGFLVVLGCWLMRGEQARARAAVETGARQWFALVSERLNLRQPPTVVLAGDEAAFSPSMTERYEKGREALREGRTSEAREILEALLDDENLALGHSAAGLPLKPLVLRALLACDAGSEGCAPRAAALMEACVAQPSPLSARLAEEAAEYHHDSQLLATARLATEAVSVREARQLAWTASRPWTTWRGETWYGDFADPDHIRVTSLTSMREWVKAELAEIASAFPAGLSSQIDWHGHRLAGDVREVLANGLAGPYEVSVGWQSPEVWLASQRRRYAWMGVLLVFSVVVTGLALWATWNAFRRQSDYTALQSDFIASVSHELRTPVASIGVLSERLESGQVTSEEQASQYHGFIARETKRLADLVDNILDFSRIEQGRKQFQCEPTDFPKLVRETVELLRPRADERSVQLRTEIDRMSSDLTPEVDALAIRRALVNLIDNAIKFSPPDTWVVVKMSTVNQALHLRVEDAGIGIPEAYREKIFERFFRIDGGLRRETSGAGIGLSLVKHIVESHGGKVDVESDPRGKGGSTFTMILPNNSS